MARNSRTAVPHTKKNNNRVPHTVFKGDFTWLRFRIDSWVLTLPVCFFSYYIIKIFMSSLVAAVPHSSFFFQKYKRTRIFNCFCWTSFGRRQGAQWRVSRGTAKEPSGGSAGAPPREGLERFRSERLLFLHVCHW